MKKFFLSIFTIFCVAASNLTAQNTSHNLNSVPVGGVRTVAVGIGAGLINSGSDNAFMGYNAGNSNTTGNYNIGIGSYALKSNTTGYGNVANGYKALFSNNVGWGNVANGY